ncbi:DEAD/DEAH box helicase family protein [Bacillus paranthracis]|uniref:DEAD/DEAH box helicase family protein n=1 Tax=Bacillus paranthracis TaxID=2026186 RepID=UPI0020B7E595|nr:DEAD/DEAH box helicase family protein [Bacillus paranthracis]
MDLSTLVLNEEYRSDKCNLVNEFYVPCLSNSVIYKRSVGYFTSQSLAMVAKGLIQLINNGGRLQLIASPKLEEKDIEAIELGYEARKDIITKVLLRQLDNIEENIIKQRLGFLAKLIAEDRLDFKIAVPKDRIQKGIYHEKLGVFEDDLGNIVAFSGSANETEGGLVRNFEQIDVFCSWKKADAKRANSKKLNFEELWKDNTNNLQIMNFTSAIRAKLIKFKQYAPSIDPDVVYQGRNNVEILNKRLEKKPALPKDLHLRDYQKDAIKSWFLNDGSGIYEMATGTGKTITALATGVILYQKISELALIIVCPYAHLVEQWAKEAKIFNFDPVLAYDSKKLWINILNQKIVSYNIGNSSNLCVITTNKTFISPSFQESIRKIKKSSMLIVDEAHHLGAKKSIENLSEDINYRLAISATPYRWMDSIGTQKIMEYFAPGVIFSFGLEKAIGVFLTEYYYYPHIVTLTYEESERYYELSKRIARYNNYQTSNLEIDLSTEQFLKRLLIKRAKLIGRAVNKTKLLYTILKEKANSKYNIFYCGDETVDGVRQIEEVTKMLGNDLGMRVQTFTSKESNEERKRILGEFENGDLQGLVAIKCLDEGIDIPITETAYILASSTNPREFIQRRGRVLRKHPNKKYSYIHDFIVIPRGLDEVEKEKPETFNIERALIRKELKRVDEFARLSRNAPEARMMVLEIKKKYNLLDL